MPQDRTPQRERATTWLLTGSLIVTTIVGAVGWITHPVSRGPGLSAAAQAQSFSRNGGAAPARSAPNPQSFSPPAGTTRGS